MHTIRSVISALVLIAAASGTSAQMPMKDGKGKGDMKTMSDATPMAEGEIRRIDKDAGKVTIKHGPIKTDTLDMDPMTMVFQVKDKAVLETVKAGDKVKFKVVDERGQMTVTEIRPTQ